MMARARRIDRRDLDSAARVALATMAYGLVHSALASRQAKDAAAHLFGHRHRNGLYRAFYNTQAIVTFVALLWYVARLPDRVLYRASGPVALALRLGQATALVYALAAARAVGWGGITGLAGVVAWTRALSGAGAPANTGANLQADSRAEVGSPAVPPEPEAQGPSLAADGQLRVAGPFRWSRHPLNVVPVPILWLAPTMTLKRAALSTVATVYLVLGSWHEEVRLNRAYGSIYRAYRRSGVPFYVPRPSRGAARGVGTPDQ